MGTHLEESQGPQDDHIKEGLTGVQTSGLRQKTLLVLVSTWCVRSGQFKHRWWLCAGTARDGTWGVKGYGRSGHTVISKYIKLSILIWLLPGPYRPVICWFLFSWGANTSWGWKPAASPILLSSQNSCWEEVFTGQGRDSLSLCPRG